MQTSLVIELAGNPLNTYWYAPSSIQSRTSKTLNIWFQGRNSELPVSGQSCKCFDIWMRMRSCWLYMQFACAWRCMLAHLSELKIIIHNTYGAALQLGVKANAPKHTAPAWHFLSAWTLADSLQNVTALGPTANVWMGTHEGKLICLSLLTLYWDADGCE